jgi:hypothetical protein
MTIFTVLVAYRWQHGRMRGRVILIVSALVVSVAPTATAEPRRPPPTGFEERQGAGWTTLSEEAAFLKSVDRASSRVQVSTVGSTVQGRPIRLARIGHPSPPAPRDASHAPVALFVCTQHGNEPAPREGCLQMLRTLSLTTDAGIVSLLRSWTVLVIPTANPDGRAANVRENAKGVDVNRDHLNLVSPEARAIGAVIRDWRPDIVLDLHEFGPGVPLVYDDDLLYLWPRNLNVDAQIYGLSKTLAIDYIGKGARREGYTADEYGMLAVGDQDVTQTAGDADEGILRNTVGLRHGIGILVESKVDMRLSPDEAVSSAAVNLRRVASHRRAILETLRFMREQRDVVSVATYAAPSRKAAEGRRRSAPVYFGGADNDPPQPSEIADPPPCGYRLTASQAKKVERTFALHRIGVLRSKSGGYVALGQPAEPVLPLLLDARGARSTVAAKPVDRC